MPAQDSINLLENAELIKDLRRRNRGMGETLRECRHVCCFIIFLGLFTGLIMIESFANFYSFEKSIRDKFDNVSGTGLRPERGAPHFPFPPGAPAAKKDASAGLAAGGTLGLEVPIGSRVVVRAPSAPGSCAHFLAPCAVEDRSARLVLDVRVFSWS